MTSVWTYVIPFFSSNWSTSYLLTGRINYLRGGPSVNSHTAFDSFCLKAAELKMEKEQDETQHALP